MAYQDRETVIVDRSGGTIAGIVAGVLSVVIVVLGFLWFFNGYSGTGRIIDVDGLAVSATVQPDEQ